MKGTTAILATACLLAAAHGAAAQTRCSAFLLQQDGSWRSFTDDEFLLPGGPLPFHKGERFSRRDGGPKAMVARILDAQCRPDGPLY